MRSPWEPLIIGLVLWAVGGAAALLAAAYDQGAAVVIGTTFGALGALPMQVGLIALGVRLGNESARSVSKN